MSRLDDLRVLARLLATGPRYDSVSRADKAIARKYKVGEVIFMKKDPATPRLVLTDDGASLLSNQLGCVSSMMRSAVIGPGV